MKKMLLILALSVFGFANAQKGSVLLMGSVEYNSQNTSYTLGDNKQNYFGFSPKVGYQFHENWTAGIEANIGTFKNKDENVTLQKTTNFSTGGFIRYTKPLSETFSFYTDLGLGYQSRKEAVGSPGSPLTDQKGDGLYVNMTPAIFINVSKGFGLNFNIGGLGYNTLSYDNDGADVRTFNFTFGRSFSIGVSKNF